MLLLVFYKTSNGQTINLPDLAVECEITEPYRQEAIERKLAKPLGNLMELETEAAYLKVKMGHVIEIDKINSIPWIIFDVKGNILGLTKSAVNVAAEILGHLPKCRTYN